MLKEGHFVQDGIGIQIPQVSTVLKFESSRLKFVGRRSPTALFQRHLLDLLAPKVQIKTRQIEKLKSGNLEIFLKVFVYSI